MRTETQPLTQVEFTEADHDVAERVARALGYQQTAYTSTSALWGLFCLPENPEHGRGPYVERCIIKTRELGIVVVQTLEDLGLEDDGTGELREDRARAQASAARAARAEKGGRR